MSAQIVRLTEIMNDAPFLQTAIAYEIRVWAYVGTSCILECNLHQFSDESEIQQGRLRRQADNLTQFNPHLKNVWIYSSTLLYAFFACTAIISFFFKAQNFV